MRAHRGALFGRQRSEAALPQPGSVYRFRGPDGLVETAQVVAMVSGISGIPHVRYEVMIERPSYGRMLEGPKLLNLDSFLSHFTEAAPAQILAAE